MILFFMVSYFNVQKLCHKIIITKCQLKLEINLNLCNIRIRKITPMKKILITLVTVLLTIAAYGQAAGNDTIQAIVIDEQQEKPPFKDKLYLGGNLGLMFGTYTNIIVAPALGIRWSKRFNSEISIEYNYTKDTRYDSDYSYNQYGGRVSTQFFVIPQIFAHAEFAGLSMEQYYTTGKERHFVPFLYLGGGFRQNIGGRSSVSFRIMFDVLNNEYSPYSPGTPVYSVGFGIGL